MQCKVPICQNDVEVPNKCNLVASASVLGVVIVGCTKPELRILTLKSITNASFIDQKVPIRVIPLPSQPFQISINCDNTLVAVDVNINGTPHIQLYSVPSLLTNVSSMLCSQVVRKHLPE